MTNTFSERLKELRTKKELNQALFAKCIGTNQSTLSAYESGDRLPPYDILVSIATIFDVSIDWLCGLSDRKNINAAITTYTDIIQLLISLQNTENLSTNFRINHHPGTPNSFDIPHNTLDISIDSKRIIEFYEEWRDIRSVCSKTASGTKLYDIWLKDVCERYSDVITDDSHFNSDDLPFN